MMQLQYNTRAYRPRQSAQQRIAGLVFIAALHAGVVYVLLTALGQLPMPRVPKPFDGYVIPIDTPELPNPVPPQPKFAPPPIGNPIVPSIEIQLEPGPRAITEPVAPPQIPSEQEPAHGVQPEPLPSPPIVFTPARPIAPTHTTPDYPPVSRRLAEQGTLRLRLSITADGTVSDAQLESSSGHKRLDDAAVEWVKAHWRYEPAREGVKAVASTTVAVVTFKLQ
jgi:protein TonB